MEILTYPPIAKARGSSQNIPHWVESWLENYIKAKYYDEIVNAIETVRKDIQVIEED